MWQYQCYLVVQWINLKGHTERDPLLSPEAKAGRLEKEERTILRFSCTIYSIFWIFYKGVILVAFSIRNKCLELTVQTSGMKHQRYFVGGHVVGIETRGRGLALFSSVMLDLGREDPLAGVNGQPGVGMLWRWLSPMSAAGPGRCWGTSMRHANVACVSSQRGSLRSSRSSTR